MTGLTWAPDGTSELVASLGWSTRSVGGLCALRWDRTGVGGLDVVARAWTRGGRILNLASSPDRTRVAVTCPNETMQLYQLYDAPSSAKKGAFANLHRDVRRWDHVLGGGPGQVLR